MVVVAVCFNFFVVSRDVSREVITVLLGLSCPIVVFRSPHSKSWSCKNNSVFNAGGARFYDQRLDTKLVTVADAEVSMGWVWVDPWVGLGWVNYSNSPKIWSANSALSR